MVIEADKAGRTVEYDRDKKTGDYLIEVKGRAGSVARSVNLRGDRVVLLEEIPA